MRRSRLLLILEVCVYIGGLGACEAPARQATDSHASDKRQPIVLASSTHGEDLLGRMLDSLLKGKPEPTCLDGLAVNVNSTVVGPLNACLVQSADTSVYYYNYPDGRVVVVGWRYYVAPEALESVADSVHDHLAALYGPGEECRIRAADRPPILRRVRWALDGYTLQLIVQPLDTNYYVTIDGRDIPRVAFEATKGKTLCSEWAGEPGWR